MQKEQVNYATVEQQPIQLESKVFPLAPDYWMELKFHVQLKMPSRF
jgi:hypothetical protein